MPKKARLSYPRINCCIPGCKRGTTKVAPGHDIVCGKCWRRAPKDLRDRASRWKRRASMFERRGDLKRADLSARRANIAFSVIVDLLSGRTPVQDAALPPLMAEELRKAGLL